MYGIPTTKQFVVKHSLRLLLPLVLANWCFPCRAPAVVSQHIWTPFSNVPFSIWESLDGTLCHVNRKRLLCFQGKYPNGNAENEVSMAYYTTQQCIMKLAFSLPRMFLETRAYATEALLSIAFNSALKSWFSNSCLIFGPTKFSSFISASLVLGTFCLKQTNPSLYLPIAFTNIFYQTELDMQWLYTDFWLIR